MFKQFLLSSLLCLSSFSVLAQTNPPADTKNILAQCLAENTTGKDRKDLARWIFVSIGAHPEMRSSAKMNPNASENAAKTMGQLVNRLLADTCPKEAKAAFQDDAAQQSFEFAFRILGELAMQELMSHPDVSKSMALFQKYLDLNRLTPIFQK